MKKIYSKQFSVFNTSLHLMCFAVLLLLSVFKGYSQVIVDFTPRQSSFNIQGDFSMIGNTNLTLADYDDTSSNGEDMIYVDIDGDTRTFNSSSSQLEFSTENGALPECSNIIYAGLYWTGRSSLDGADANDDGDGNSNTFSVTKDGTTKVFDKTKVLFKGPGFGYQEITATGIQFPDNASNNMYAAYADVTQIVIDNGGAGTYTVGDIATIEGNGYPTGYYGGWGLVVVYDNYKMKWRDITVFDGFAYVSSGGGNQFIDINGFKAVENGDVNIKFGVMAGEGDVGVGGDRLSIIIPNAGDDKDNLSTLDDNSYRDLVHPGNVDSNFFNSSIYTHGGVPGKRTPDLANNTGVDIAMFNIENSDKSLIRNGQDYTRFKYNSTQDTYIIFNATFAVDAYIPEPEGVLTATTVSGSPTSSLNPTDQAVYAIDIKNRGSEATDNTTLTIPLPDSVDPDNLDINYKTNTAYVPVTSTPTYVSTIGTNGAIVWNIGTLPVPPDPDIILASISFSLTVTTDCEFYEDRTDKFVSVNGKISGVGQTSGAPFDLTLIQGYEMSGNCIGATIAAPIVIPITYRDYVNSPPTGDAPAAVTVACGEELPMADITSVTNLRDNSGDVPTVAFVDDVSNNASPEIITRTYSISDECGNVTNVTQEITRMPSPPPTAICQDFAVTLDASGNATITADQINNGSSACSGGVTLSVSPSTFTCSNVGANTVTLTVTDEGGQTSTCTSTVTVTDDIDPVALCQNATIYLNAAGGATLDPSDIDAGSNDICGIKTLEVDKESFTCADLGSNTVTLTVTDNNDNVSTCTAEVIVEDNVPPTAICTNITIQLDASGSASIVPEDIDGGSSDNCTTITLSASQSTFDCTNLGENSVILTVTDGNNLESTCTALVTVEDNVAPEAICFSDIDVAIDSAGNASISVADINNGSTDNCSIDTIAIDQTEFDCSNLGANTVTLTVTDTSGNIDTCTTTVNIVDNQGPAVACKNITVELDNTGVATIVPGDIDDGSSDCSGLGSTSLSQSIFDCSNLGDNNVTLTVIDNVGNEESCTAVVTVLDTVKPTVICQDFTAQLDTTGNVTITTANIDNGSSDACGIDTITLDVTTFNCDNIGNNAVTLTVTDLNGNSDSCTANVTVEDNVAPTALCQAITVQLDATGNASITADQIDNGSTDACGIASLALDITTFDCTSVGDNTVELTVTDNNGNSSTCTTTVTVEDNVPPTALCQAITVQLDNTGNASITPNQIDNGSIDSCGVDTLTLDITTFDCSNIGDNTVELTVTDINGNSATCTTTVTIEDNIPPTAICQPLTAQLDATGNVTITPESVNNVSTDACGIQSLSLDKTTFDCSNIGDNTVELTVTDNNGNSATCTTIVTIEDNVAPEVLCKDVTVQLSGEGFVTILPSDIDNGSFDTCGDITMTVSPSVLECSNVGDNTVTLTVTDEEGNQNTCTATVTVEDITPPTAICQAITVQLDAAGNATITPDQIENGSTDSCGLDTFALDITTFDCSNIGDNTVELTVTDINGNSSTCTTIVTVEDNVPPTAICQPLTAQLDATGNVTITPESVNNVSTDACGIQSLSLDKTTFDCSNIGDNTVELTVTDNNGNSATCTTTVTVEDNVAPEVLCKDVTVQLSGEGFVTILPSDIDNGSFDNCGDITMSVSPSILECSNVGDNTVTLTVTDEEGNQNTCIATVTVEDITPPTAICQAITVQLDAAGNATITPDQIENGSTDSCGVDTFALDITTFDCSNIGDNTVILTVTDINGNSSTCTTTVAVEDNITPNVICQDIVVQLNSSGIATITADDVDNGSNDNCSAVTLSVSNTSFDCSNVGPNTVTLTAVDDYGNEASCDATVTVEDNIAPVIACKNITVRLDETGSVTIEPSDIDDGSSDCGSEVTLSASQTVFDCTNIGANTVTLTVTDAFGNEDTCEALVTVEDIIPPTAICQAITIQLDTNGNATITADDIDNGSSDVCSTVTLSISQTDFDCSDIGDNTVTLSVKDIYENESTCDAIVTVEDNIPPTVLCKDITIQLNETGTVSILPIDIDAGSTDCSGDVTYAASQTTFDCSNVGANTVTLTVSDSNGNDASCSAIVTVEDITPPTAICQAITVQLDADGNATITPEQIDNGSNDSCGIASITLDTTSFTCENIGDNSVELTVIDANNNSSTCTAIVTIEDSIAPTAVCANITVQLNSSGNADIVPSDIDGGSTDNCGIPELTASQLNFSCADVGENTVTLTVTDASGNEDTCTAIVTVEDTIEPTVLCKNITVQLDNTGSVSILPQDIDGGSADCSGQVSLSASQTTFDCTNIGENTVTLTVTDINDNESFCDAIVTVEDIIAPTAICQAVTIQLDTDGNASITPDQIDNGSNDACGIQSIALDKTSFTCEDIGDNTVELTVTDNNNNTSTCTAIVTVEDNIPPTALCQSITIQLDTNGSATIVAADVDNGSNDNCGLVTLAVSQTIFTCADVGDNTVTLEVTDANNNVTTCTATVTVEDNVPPTALCSNITIQLDETGTANIQPSDIDGGSSDTCGTVTLTASQTTFDCSNIGDVAVIITATDINGNSSSCEATVTVEDNIPPTITCPADIIVAADAGQCTATNVDLGNTITDDNCAVASITNNALEPFVLGETIVTWTVTDTSGNETTCLQKVTVTDGNLPEVVCPADVSVFVDSDSCSATNVELGTLDIQDCTSVIVENDAPTSFLIGDTVVNWTVTDSEGNVSNCTQTVTVVDNIPPTFVEALPIETITIECNAIPAPETLTGADNCNTAVVTFNEERTNGNCTNNYILERTWTVTDAANLTTSYTQTITVQDTTAPTFVGDLPSANLVAECDSVPNAQILSAEDSCGSASVTVQDIITTGDCTSNYTISRIWTAEDECENKTSYTQIITVRDTTLPVFDGTLPASTLQAECDAIPNAEILTATDNCGTANVEVNDVRTDGDCPSNYTITRTWTATDDCGLAATHTQIITVTDTTAPTPITTFDAVLEVSCKDIPEIPTIQFTDSCSDNVTVQYSETNSFDKTMLVDYQIVRSWVATDACDNSETYTQTLNVALDEIYFDIVAPDWCYKEGVVDLNEFIDETLDTDGTWELLEGDLKATLTNNIFDPSTLELSADFLPNDGGIDYLFRYSTTNDGCISITEVTMNIHADCDVLPCGETDIDISTAITPNGDGINDTFDISGIDLCGFVANVKIFNRWGAIVYESSNYTLGSMSTSGSEGDWDGYSPKSSIGNNGTLPNGTYYYIIYLQDSGLEPLTGPIYLGTK